MSTHKTSFYRQKKILKKKKIKKNQYFGVENSSLSGAGLVNTVNLRISVVSIENKVQRDSDYP